MVKSFQLAFQDVAGNWSTASIERMYHDPEFKHAFWFTLLLVVVIVPLQFVIALVMALIVNATLNSAPSAGYLYGAMEVIGVPADAAKRKGVVLGYRLVGSIRINPAAPKYAITASPSDPAFLSQSAVSCSPTFFIPALNSALGGRTFMSLALSWSRYHLVFSRETFQPRVSPSVALIRASMKRSALNCQI